MSARLYSNVFLAALAIMAGMEAGLAQPSPAVPQVVRDRIAAEGRTRVIVELGATSAAPNGSPSAEQTRRQRAEIAAQRARLRSRLGQGSHRFVHEFADAPFVALDIDASTLAELESADSPAVRILEDRLLAPTLTESVPLIEATVAHQAALNGGGTVIAVVDSGVDRAHAFLAPRVVAEACFASAESGPGGDCPNGQATEIGPGAGDSCDFAPLACGHGTHVAGIAAGFGSDFSGVAPGASLIAVQVFHASTQCLFFFEEVPCPRAYESDIVAGLEYVSSLRNQYNIAAINMSLGGTAYDSACDAESPLFSAVINNLKSFGIATVAASGNEALTEGIAEPACIAAAISVGATTDEDEVAWFSNASADLDLLAPGEGIYSSVPGGDFEELDGTSMAAPHVAGAWAIYKQAHPTATVDEALASFVGTGTPIADQRGGPTKPRIRVGAAVGLASPAPVITSISPSAVNVFGPSVTLQINGSGFVGSSKVSLDGSPQRTTFVDDSTLTVSVGSSQIPASGGTVSVTVSTPPPGGGVSNAATLDVVVPALEVDSTSVATGAPVTVTLANAPGGATDWLALAAVGSPNTSYTFVGFASSPSGTWTVNMPQTPGTYEFRLFLNYGYTRAATSAAITVAVTEPEPEPEPEPAPATTLSVSTTSAAPGAPVTVTLANAPGGATDWLALAAVGSPNTSYTFVGFASSPSGTWTVNMPQTPGTYEFRLFLNYGYTRAATSAAITVAVTEPEPEPEPEPAPATTLSVSTTSAAPGAPVTVTLANAPGGATDWLALAAVGSPNTSYTFVGFASSPSGTWTVNMPQTPGTYEFRLFLNYGYTRAATSAAITVAVTEPEPEPEPEPAPATTLSVSTTSAAPGAPVTVTLANAPGGATDWLALAAVGSPNTSYTFVGFASSPSGTWTVNMPQTPGTYEFRLFLNYGYTRAATSAAITVAVTEPEPEPEPEPAPATTLSVSTTSAAPGAPVTVTLANAPGGATDWLALAAVGSPNTSYTFVGFASSPSGTWTVNMPQTPGTYEFRLFLNYGYTRAATSAAITVQ